MKELVISFFNSGIGIKNKIVSIQKLTLSGKNKFYNFLYDKDKKLLKK